MAEHPDMAAIERALTKLCSAQHEEGQLLTRRGYVSRWAAAASVEAKDSALSLIRSTISKLEEENERLRDLLARVSDRLDEWSHDPLVAEARAALAQQPTTKGEEK